MGDISIRFTNTMHKSILGIISDTQPEGVGTGVKDRSGTKVLTESLFGAGRSGSRVPNQILLKSLTLSGLSEFRSKSFYFTRRNKTNYNNWNFKRIRL